MRVYRDSGQCPAAAPLSPVRASFRQSRRTRQPILVDAQLFHRSAGSFYGRCRLWSQQPLNKPCNNLATTVSTTFPTTFLTNLFNNLFNKPFQQRTGFSRCPYACHTITNVESKFLKSHNDGPLLRTWTLLVKTGGRGRGIDATKKCSGCNLVYYCARKCQVADYKEHRIECAAAAAQAAAGAGAGAGH